MKRLHNVCKFLCGFARNQKANTTSRHSKTLSQHCSQIRLYRAVCTVLNSHCLPHENASYVADGNVILGSFKVLRQSASQQFMKKA